MCQKGIASPLEVIRLSLRPVSVGCCVIQKHRVGSNKQLIVIVQINGGWFISEPHDMLAGCIQSLAKHAATIHTKWSKTS